MITRAWYFSLKAQAETPPNYRQSLTNLLKLSNDTLPTRPDKKEKIETTNTTWHSVCKSSTLVQNVIGHPLGTSFICSA